MASPLAIFSTILFLICSNTASAALNGTTVQTTSGTLVGTESNGVVAFKGIRYAQAPVGSLRWEAPAAYTSNDTTNVAQLGASCIQQFPPPSNVTKLVFDNPAPASESEDCLFLNVWAPTAQSSGLIPVIFWIHGGGFGFGSASLPVYDGTSLATNQDVVVVTINYRMNLFGFPSSADPNEISVQGHNLGLLDQDLALQWTKNNIAAFGGDPQKITVMGQSAGGSSVSYMLNRYNSSSAPFQSAILLSSGWLTDRSVKLDNGTWTSLALAIGCTGPSGQSRLSCMKGVPAANISAFGNGPNGPTKIFTYVDNFTVFEDPFARISNKEALFVPILQGNVQDEGTVFTLTITNNAELTVLLNKSYENAVTLNQVTSVYSNLSGMALAAEFVKDFSFICPASLHVNTYQAAGLSTIYRYVYGAVFPDLDLIPSLGTFHGSELGEIFGTYDASTASTAETQLSGTWQTIIGNFVKNATSPPASGWPLYQPSNGTATVAKLAYQGNVALDNVVQTVPSGPLDAFCTLAWDAVLVNPLGSGGGPGGNSSQSQPKSSTSKRMSQYEAVAIMWFTMVFATVALAI